MISVGATTSYRINLQTGYGGARLPGVSGYLDNNISSLSSGGETEAGRTVDLVAPGELGWALCTPSANYYGCTNYLGAPSPILVGGGTSESAPLTAGAAALVIEAYRGSHGGASPTPAQVKNILVSTADDISAPADQQGAGILDTYKAVRAAVAAPTGPAASSLLVTPAGDDGGDQIDASGAPGTRISSSVEVTNVGSKKQTLSLAPRRLGGYSSLVRTSVTLSDATSMQAPDYSGTLTDNVEKVTFTVPAGADRLDANIAYTSPITSSATTAGEKSRVRISLVDPKGRLASYDLPQGAGNYGDSEVANPVAGRWIAYVYSRTSTAGGTTGPVLFRARVANYTSPGSVSPSSLTLKPGQAGSFTYTAATPATPGDSATSLVLSNAGGTVTTVPVILRSVLPVTKAARSFKDTLTGGNGRESGTGQTFYYQLAVPSGLAALNASVALKDDAGSTFTVTLVDPNGDAVGTGGNTVTAPAPGGAISATQQLAGVAHTLKPVAGTWDLAVNFYNQVQGDRLQTPFTVSVDGTPTPVTTSASPTGFTVPAGGSVSGSISVINTTPATEEYFLDARLDKVVSVPLVVANGTTALPADNEPTFTVPTNTTSVTVTSTADQNVTFDTGYDFGDPDIAALSEGHVATATYQASPVAQGGWFALPSEFGPYTDDGPPVGTQTTTAAVKTSAFDNDVTSPTGDLWQTAVDPTATVTPVIVRPGATAVIPVTIAAPASAAVGSVLKGTLYLDDYTLVNVGLPVPSGAEVAAVPYSYTVGAAGSTPGVAPGKTTPVSTTTPAVSSAEHFAAEMRMLARTRGTVADKAAAAKAEHFAAQMRMLARTRAVFGR